jgi:putative hydrolase of HD superfamily
MQKPDIHRVIEFHSLLLQFQGIKRIVNLPETFEQENDIEHSYSLAMMAWFLCQYFPELDRDTVIRYALVHDLVEVHAGDTYIFADATQLDSKAEREAAALKKLVADWPDFPELTKEIVAYEAHSTPEAKFVYALDKVMPVIVIYLSKGYTWQKEGITPEQLHEIKKHKIAVSPEIQPYYDQLYKLTLENRHYFSGDPAAKH